MKHIRIIKIEKDYLVYFLNSRVTIHLNEIGAKICNWIYNENLTKKEVLKKLSYEYLDKSIEDIEKILNKFLNELYSELSNTNINLLEEIQLTEPLGVELEITTACNLRCKHCFQGEYLEEYLSYPDFKEIIDLLYSNNICEINLVGGEVFKHRDILKMIKYINKKGLAQTIITNGTLINEKTLEELTKINNLRILVSVDGTKELHDKIRGRGQFDLIIPKIKLMKSKNINIEMLCTLNALNSDYINEIINMSEEIEVPINFNLFKPFTKTQTELILDPIKYFKIVEKLVDLRINKKKKIGISNASLCAYILGEKSKNECTATLAGLVINHKKKMITCPYLIEAGYYNEKDLPDFDKNFLKNWKNSKIFKEFRNNGQKECQVRSLIFSGDVKGYDPYGIEAYKIYKKSK
ncbi:MAG: radical SAM protein [Clostridium sp.]